MRVYTVCFFYPEFVFVTPSKFGPCINFIKKAISSFFQVINSQINRPQCLRRPANFSVDLSSLFTFPVTVQSLRSKTISLNVGEVTSPWILIDVLGERPGAWHTCKQTPYLPLPDCNCGPKRKKKKTKKLWLISGSQFLKTNLGISIPPSRSCCEN